MFETEVFSDIMRLSTLSYRTLNKQPNVLPLSNSVVLVETEKRYEKISIVK